MTRYSGQYKAAAGEGARLLEIGEAADFDEAVQVFAKAAAPADRLAES